jgi:hypothetical protein
MSAAQLSKAAGRVTDGASGIASIALQEHFTCRELAEKWHMSESTVFKLFVGEAGIIKLGSRSARKRTKVSIRIPLSVAERVYKALQS